ncbi:Na(+)/H(+) antiporter subunit G [Novipirellula aureliae]|uniref:Na(+)/H(+) antiporter subunit G n=1 Tax=Novipirellula aureliae TaxID=2527966 RepID=A0A5C6E903_9BACT|nr:monovalent cation/H(+) antiporter subunit G [Novipirellula aureliae]TWU45025.1 Na(+)/H(+) antiporter subunit G [Novipirellula aureliae]
MIEGIVVVLLVIGTSFALLASIAILRMPDLYTRMHGSTKCATLGVGCTILAAAIEFENMGTTTAAILIVGFLFLTAPVAAHMIGRAAYRDKVAMWPGTIVEEVPPSEDRHAIRIKSGKNQT